MSAGRVNNNKALSMIYGCAAQAGEMWRNGSDAAVNQLVVGSVPTAGANFLNKHNYIK